MIKSVRQAKELKGKVSVPGDKSISHRAAIFNSMAEGTATVSNFLAGADCLSTVSCMRALGAEIEIHGSIEGASEGEPVVTLTVRGVGSKGFIEPGDVLDAGNSGTTMRLISGVLAAQPFLTILTGDNSLRSRPMARIIQPLRSMGATIFGRRGDTLAPLAVKGGGLRGIEYKMPVASAQVKSALLLASLFAEGKTVLHQPAISRDHTERMLSAMGAVLYEEDKIVSIEPLSRPLKSVNVDVPGDFSSAAFWLVAGAIHPSAKLTIENVGINWTRTGLLEVLRQMGAQISIQNERLQGGEPVGELVVESSRLKGVEVSGDIIPRLIDEIPVLAVAAAVAEGKTVIRDAQELRTKESDRIKTTVSELSKLGVRIEETEDGMIIYGGSKLSGRECDSFLDHRLAMSLAVSGLIATGETLIENSESVDISYPSFWEDLIRLST